MRVSSRKSSHFYSKNALVRLYGVPQMFAIEADDAEGWVDVIDLKEAGAPFSRGNRSSGRLVAPQKVNWRSRNRGGELVSESKESSGSGCGCLGVVIFWLILTLGFNLPNETAFWITILAWVLA